MSDLTREEVLRQLSGAGIDPTASQFAADAIMADQEGRERTDTEMVACHQVALELNQSRLGINSLGVTSGRPTDATWEVSAPSTRIGSQMRNALR